MGMTAIQAIMVLEGIVSSHAFSAHMNFPQVPVIWLKGMKESLTYAARQQGWDDDFDLDYFASVIKAEQTIHDDHTYLYGVLARSENAEDALIQIWDIADPDTGVAAVGVSGGLSLLLGSATSVSVGAVVWQPYLYCPTACTISATDSHDGGFVTDPAGGISCYTISVKPA